MPSNEVWLQLNKHLFKTRPKTILHIWADVLKSDFAFLGKMSNVQILELNQVKFKKKETLSDLINLRELTLLNGNVNELNFLGQLENLQKLEIGRIRGLNSISFISKLKKLEYLNINNQAQIEKLPNFSSLGLLKELSIDNLKRLKDISNIVKINSLESLFFNRLDKNLEPKDFKLLTKLRKLKKVNGYFNTKNKNKLFDEFVKLELKIRSA